MRIGVIGTGSMGGMLAKAFLKTSSGACEVEVCNRSQAKLDALIERNPGLQKRTSPIEVVQSSDVIILSVKAKDAWHIIEDIQPFLRPNQYFVSINSAISIQELEEAVPCRVVKIIPSITQEALSGVVLTMYGKRLTDQDIQEAHQLLSSIGKSVVIKEEDLRICSDLTSCGPAFLSFMLTSMAKSAERQSQISYRLAETLIREMAIGTAKLITENGFTLDEIMERVAVPGGVTSAGLHSLDLNIHDVYDQLFLTTHQMQAQHTVSRRS